MSDDWEPVLSNTLNVSNREVVTCASFLHSLELQQYSVSSAIEASICTSPVGVLPTINRPTVSRISKQRTQRTSSFCKSRPLPPLRRSRRGTHFLVRIPHLIVLAHKVLPPPLSCDVLHEQLADMGLHEAANEARVPELRRDPEVFAAAHQGVGFAAFGSGRDAVGVEVLLFSAGKRDEAGIGVLVVLLYFSTCRVGAPSYRPPQTRPYSLVTSLPVTIVSPLGARPHPPGPNVLFNMRLYLISGR